MRRGPCDLKKRCLRTSIRDEQMPAIQIKRIHDPVEDGDGTRILVDRVWPRGIRKSAARIDAWHRDLAPSSALRRWFAHDPARWDAFRECYRAELKDQRQKLLELARHANYEQLTLVYGARDRAHNQAVVLREVLEELRQAPHGAEL